MSTRNDCTTHNENRFDNGGYDSDGYDARGFDCDGFNRAGFDGDGYNAAGFNDSGIHRDTGTEFNERGLTESGNYFNDDGYNCDGYDEEGYDENGEDSEGNTRDDNERREQGEDFDNELAPYETDVLEELGFSFLDGQRDELLAGHEIEMYSDEVDISDVSDVSSQLGQAYRKHDPQTSYGSCAIGKHDGSLENGPGGFETVTVPLTRAQTYGIFESFDVLGSGRCSAWSKGSSVGHHIHVSRSAITPLTLGKLGVFMNLPANREFMTVIAQRSARYNGFEEEKKLTKFRPRARHSVLNVTGETVEFRLFKSNLKTRCILKNYEFAIAAVKFCRSTSHRRLFVTDFLRFVAENRKEFGYLHTFLMNSEAWGDAYRYCGSLPQNVAFPKEQGKKPAVNVSTGV
jgi:hypothetical protein